MSSLPESKDLVIVHTLDYPAMRKVIENAGVKPPFYIHSFVDSGRDAQNAAVYGAVQRADVVLLQQSRTGVLNSAVELAIQALLDDSREENDVLFFNDDGSMYVKPTQVIEARIAEAS